MTRDHAAEAFAQRRWADAYAFYIEADANDPLTIDDLECAARAAQLLGRDSDADGFWQRAIQQCEQDGAQERVARNCFWLGMSLTQRGDMAQAGAWFGRAARAAAECGPDNVVAGFLILPEALGALFGGDAKTAQPMFAEI